MLIPKKNGKSQLLAAIGRYLLCGDPTAPVPPIAIGTNSEHQAGLVFGAAQEMVLRSPKLSELLVGAKEIHQRANPGATLFKVSEAIATNDGIFATAVILDEVHEFIDETDEAFYTVRTNATIAARQPLTLLITTAGAGLDTLCGRLYEAGKRVAAGESDAPDYLFLCWEDPTGAHDDPASWRRANPSYGVILGEAGYRAKLADPELTTAAFCRYFPNRWTGVANYWLPVGAWEACADPALDLIPGGETYVGVDASTRYGSAFRHRRDAHPEGRIPMAMLSLAEQLAIMLEDAARPARPGARAPRPRPRPTTPGRPCAPPSDGPDDRARRPAHPRLGPGVLGRFGQPGRRPGPWPRHRPRRAPR